MSDYVAENTNEIAEGPKAPAAAVGISNGNGDDSNNDNDSDKSITSIFNLGAIFNVEYSLDKSLMGIWILMGVELGFDLITTVISFI